MSGMGASSLDIHSASVSHRFYSALFFELIAILLLVGVISLVVLWRRRGTTTEAPRVQSTEPRARQILRVGFGILWLLAGLLQLQADMPLGLPIGVVSPAAQAAPSWVQSLISPFTDAWLRHPIVGASGVVWLELGLGIWLLCARRGRTSRLAGGVSAAWALGVWVIGNAMGGLFAGSVSWLFGAPGAAAFYVAAGILLALPEQSLGRERLLRRVAQGFGVLLAVLAVLQAWPGRGFWGGGTPAHPGAISEMAAAMGSVKQPAPLVTLQQHLSSFALGSSWVINLVAVVGLAGCALGLMWGSTRSIGLAARAYLILSVVTWLVIQDLGIFGGLATDVNSMLPSALFPLAIWFGLLSIPSDVAADVPAVPEAETASPPPLASGSPGRRLGIAAAIVLVVFGAGPLLLLDFIPGASADAASAAGPGVAKVELQAPEIILTDQHDKPFVLSSFQGHRVILTFLDPTCSSECPIEAQQMRAASEQLGSDSGVIFVAVNTNAKVNSPASLRVFDDQEGLSGWPNWYFVTGTPAQMAAVWKQWGVQVEVGPNGSMIMHTEPFFAIDSEGTVRSTWDAVVGEGTASALGESGTALIVRQAKALS